MSLYAENWEIYFIYSMNTINLDLYLSSCHSEKKKPEAWRYVLFLEVYKKFIEWDSHSLLVDS